MPMIRRAWKIFELLTSAWQRLHRCARSPLPPTSTPFPARRPSESGSTVKGCRASSPILRRSGEEGRSTTPSCTSKDSSEIGSCRENSAPGKPKRVTKRTIMNLSKFIEGGTYLKAGDLQGREAAVTIRAVDIAEFDDAEKVVLHFEGKTRALACNTTNTRTIAEVFGPQSEDWIGRIISIYPARVNFRGQLVDAIRVRIPQQPHHRSHPAAPATPAPPPPPPPPPAPAAASFDSSDDVPF